MTELKEASSENGIAIVGMACRVPGARNHQEYWTNLLAGKESTTYYSEAELHKRGVPQQRLEDPNYVRVGLEIPDLAAFDSEFFGLSPKEAAIMDPQHRHFLECSWEALEDSGHLPSTFEGTIGVYAGSSMSAYFMYNIMSNPELIDTMGKFLLLHTGNDKDFLTSRVSYALNLTGPAVSVQTACSTSLVAAHLGVQSLLSFESDMVLAGGVSIQIPQAQGYQYKQGEILSPDGHCRAFDERAQGTIFGSGVGVVVLRRRDEAIADGDRIYAVIQGSAINNDGADKIGYLAPSVEGQAAAITEALAVAEVSAETIDYVECHGTGTAVGDPIEVAALTAAYRETTQQQGFCGIGSVKTNIGHLDTAAGVAGLIKTALSLYHRKIPPTINYQRPNPKIEFATSPFYVVNKLVDWPQREGPRRAAVNALGVGGTNAHLILQEAPPAEPYPRTEQSQYLLMLSGRNRKVLDNGSQRLADYLVKEKPELADVAAMLHHGRALFEHRRLLVAGNLTEAITHLREQAPNRVYTHRATTAAAQVVFMFPGGGVQYPNMARGLYETEPIFRQHLEIGLSQLNTQQGMDYRRLLYPSPAEQEKVSKELRRPSYQLPLIFIVEYALARLWQSKGVQPTALIGHSMGENTAATLAGVCTFAEGLALVSLRGKLFETLPRGGMLTVQMGADQLAEILTPDLELGVENGPELSVVTGPEQALQEFARVLEQREIEYGRVHIEVAAHSRMLDPILAEFGDYLRKIKLKPPTIPIISNRTGSWLTTEQATNPEYWVEHLRHTVKFGEGIGTLLARQETVFIEVGPGKVLTTLTRQHPAAKSARGLIPTLRDREDTNKDEAHYLAALGRVYASGVPVSDQALGNTRRRPLSMPNYAFHHKQYWIEQGNLAASKQVRQREAMANWHYEVVWREHQNKTKPEARALIWIMFLDTAGIGRALTKQLKQEGHRVITVQEGDLFSERAEDQYSLSPEAGQQGYTALVRALEAKGQTPDRIVHLWMLTKDESYRPGSSFFHRNQERGFYSLFFLAKAIASEVSKPNLHLIVVVNGMEQVDDEPLPYPEKATLLGPTKVIPRENPGITCRTVDLEIGKARLHWFGPTSLAVKEVARAVNQLYPEIMARPETGQMALRHGKCLQQTWQRKLLAETVRESHVRKAGTYMITGGLGGLGLELARYLAHEYKAQLLLVSRPPFPDRQGWDVWLSTHGSENANSRRIRAIQAIEASGGKVKVATVDVTDQEAMATTVAQAEQEMGQIHGVFHAAGILRDAPITLKNQAEVEQVFAPKLHGTLVLDQLFKRRQLDFMVLYSSYSTALAPAGQVDYVAANAYLNAYARHSSGNRQTVSINWGTWRELGMTAGLTTDGSQQERTVQAQHPLFQTRTTDSRGHTTLITHLAVAKHWELQEHRSVTGKALIPGTGYIEMARAALAEQGEQRTIEITELYIMRPLHVPDQKTKQMRVRLQLDNQGYHYKVQSQPEAETLGWETHAEARLRPCRQPEEPNLPIEEIKARCRQQQRPEPGGTLRTKQYDYLELGPRWNNLRAIHLGAGEALAELELAREFAEDVNHYYLHPALLDMATAYPMALIEGYERSHELWVPVSYASIRMYDRLPARIYSWARNHGTNTVASEIASFDLTLCDETGRILMEVESFSIKKMKNKFDSFPEPTSQDLEYDKTSGNNHAEMRRKVKMGIQPSEGTAVLEAVLSDRKSAQVLVSPLDLKALMEQANKPNTGLESKTFERPELDNEYVPPKDQIERKLVAYWQDLLGVKAVGTEDSFFELGGHSLIAVRLFATIKKAFQVEYPISILFEAPTIAKVAQLIRDASTKRPEQTVTRRRHTHLVAMHAGTAGPGTPFFLVAGMFGNILNLRHLANLVGTERPFYGLQARGLYGNEQPHRDFEQMSKDYLAEIRTVQPEGPYLLGGFSGGGITAFEMAQQLKAAGEEVDLLVMLDTPLPNRPQLNKRDKLKVHLQNLKEEGVPYLGKWAKRRIKWELGKLRRRMWMEPIEAEELGAADFHNATIEAAFRQALRAYQLEKYPGKLDLYRPALDKKYDLGQGRKASADLEFVYDDNGWTPYVEQLVIREVPGNHDSMVLEPNVRRLATMLKTSINEAE